MAAWLAAVVVAVLVNGMAVIYMHVFEVKDFLVMGKEVAPSMAWNPSWKELLLGVTAPGFMAAWVAFLVGVFIGLPLYLVWGRLRQGSSTMYALTGLGIALLVVFLFKAIFLLGAVDMFLVHDVEIIIAGPVVALTFRTTMHRLGGVAVSTSIP